MYADDVVIIVWDLGQLPHVVDAFRRHKAVAGAMVKQDKSVSLLLSTWRNKSMLSNSVMGHCTKGSG